METKTRERTGRGQGGEEEWVRDTAWNVGRGLGCKKGQRMAGEGERKDRRMKEGPKDQKKKNEFKRA